MNDRSVSISRRTRHIPRAQTLPTTWSSQRLTARVNRTLPSVMAALSPSGPVTIVLIAWTLTSKRVTGSAHLDPRSSSSWNTTCDGAIKLTGDKRHQVGQPLAGFRQRELTGSTTTLWLRPCDCFLWKQIHKLHVSRLAREPLNIVTSNFPRL